MQKTLVHGMTASRLLLARRMANKIQKNKSIYPEMFAFVGLDVLDGVVARKYDLDDKTRRVSDAVVDKISQFAVLNALYNKKPNERPAIKSIVFAEGITILSGLASNLKRQEVTKGGLTRKLSLVALAGYVAHSNQSLDSNLNVAGGIVTVSSIVHATRSLGNVFKPLGEVN